LEAAVDAIVARHGLRRTRGKCVLELRPRLDWHKGKAVTYLLEALDLLAPDVLPLYIGDDVTDEDAFRALRARGGLGVRVASADDWQPTCAQLRLDDTAEVCKFLEHFAGAAVAGLGVAPAAVVPEAVSASR
jgi:trehalose 6-phosphate phosphatase